MAVRSGRLLFSPVESLLEADCRLNSPPHIWNLKFLHRLIGDRKGGDYFKITKNVTPAATARMPIQPIASSTSGNRVGGGVRTRRITVEARRVGADIPANARISCSSSSS